VLCEVSGSGREDHAGRCPTSNDVDGTNGCWAVDESVHILMDTCAREKGRTGKGLIRHSLRNDQAKLC